MSHTAHLTSYSINTLSLDPDVRLPYPSFLYRTKVDDLCMHVNQLSLFFPCLHSYSISTVAMIDIRTSCLADSVKRSLTLSSVAYTEIMIPPLLPSVVLHRLS